ncbi:unnamed protein product [Rotaria sordida]|uniref:EF-hand domain-containing protein n=1 Tax=Rotaria sordida TaxID=392033 RepID=A0A814MCQ3_9BILA|nr:unnamed protein product [Rotaria sordida]CAF1077858.1 unnamed protein product [Rotaria sordida]CAF1309946.1 unnamed protein product [Rotaria sordida]CAF1323402.1 unnamed protein product [Rotaria sordida]CAF3644570.1 unnamed protein product [Rotaria sordida]
MEQLQNFGPSDVKNGILTQMFRNAGINDVDSYIGDVRRENIDFNDQSSSMINNDDYNPVNNSQTHSTQSNRIGDFLNNGQRGIDKRNNGKSSLGNVKQIYQMYKSLDKNGDGKITVEDVEILLKEMGLGFVSKHLARALFNIVDTNRNGQLDFRDVLALTSLLKRLSSSSTTSDRF